MEPGNMDREQSNRRIQQGVKEREELNTDREVGMTKKPKKRI